jgi:uncharacterized membrane protein YeiH
MLFWLEMSAVAVCAITGALEAGRRQMDLFGASVVAFATAVGGGTLRDLLLGLFPVFWIEEPYFLYGALVSVIATYLIARRTRISAGAFLIPDAAGVALFTIIGEQKALAFHSGVPIAVVMGVVTGVFGGIIRDVLCNEVPVVFRGELYATAALSGALLFAFLERAGVNPAFSLSTSVLVIFLVRVAALRWRIGLPKVPAPS